MLAAGGRKSAALSSVEDVHVCIAHCLRQSDRAKMPLKERPLQLVITPKVQREKIGRRNVCMHHSNFGEVRPRSHPPHCQELLFSSSVR